LQDRHVPEERAVDDSGDCTRLLLSRPLIVVRSDGTGFPRKMARISIDSAHRTIAATTCLDVARRISAIARGGFDVD
jgi:hypothetical protein